MPRSLKEARQAYAQAVDELQKLTEDPDKFAAQERSIADIEKEIGDLERAQRAQDVLARSRDPAGDVDPSDVRSFERALAPFATSEFSPAGSPPNARIAARFERHVGNYRRSSGIAFEAQKHYRSLGEQLQAIQQYYMSRGTNTDARLVRAPTGAGEVDPTGGGFLLQTDFAAGIWMLAHELGEVLKEVNELPIGPNANGIKVRGVDETSRATGSRWGGVQSYWAGEGVTVNPTKPKFRLIEFDLKKLMSIMYTTDELVQDAVALTAIAGQAFSEEVMFMTEDAIFNGSGAGMPFGVLNAPALISVPKQNGQAAGTIVKENIDNMWTRMWARSRKNAIWYIIQDAEAQLNQLGQVVGTGGVPVYLPPGGLSAKPYGTLYGRPVIATEYNPALGTPGDILLADMSQYSIADKGGPNAATSMHVAFLTDEMVFRITYRVDGKPMWTTALTPAKGTLTKSPFVAIAQR
jgi:HK97 family phage major capsid protein